MSLEGKTKPRRLARLTMVSMRSLRRAIRTPSGWRSAGGRATAPRPGASAQLITGRLVCRYLPRSACISAPRVADMSDGCSLGQVFRDLTGGCGVGLRPVDDVDLARDRGGAVAEPPLDPLDVLRGLVEMRAAGLSRRVQLD